MPKAFVTGGGRGIGLSISKKLASEGYSVTITGRDKSRLAESIKQLPTSKGQQHSFIVADYADISKEVEIDEDADLLINNAGYLPFSPIENEKKESVVETFNINVTAPILLTQKFVANLLKKKKKGEIVFLSSVAAIRAFPNASVYCATKGAIESFLVTLARELGPHDIKVNGVAPGVTETDMTASSEAMLQGNPLNKGKWIKPESISDGVWFVVSNPSITGTVIRIDNGLGT